MARTRSENYDEIRRGILAKAAALYSADGYMRSSISDLADACGLSRGALYHYFESKEAILYAILDAHLRRMLSAIVETRAAMTDRTDEERFRQVVSTIVAVNAESRNEQRVLLNDRLFLRADEQEHLNALGRKIVDAVSELLTTLDTGGRVTRRNRNVYAMMLFGIINYTYSWYDPAGSIGPAEYADMAVDLFLNGFSSPAARRPRMRVRAIA